VIIDVKITTSSNHMFTKYCKKGINYNKTKNYF